MTLHSPLITKQSIHAAAKARRTKWAAQAVRDDGLNVPFRNTPNAAAEECSEEGEPLPVYDSGAAFAEMLEQAARNHPLPPPFFFDPATRSHKNREALDTDPIPDRIVFPRVGVIQKTVCDEYGVGILDVLSPRRAAHIVRPRQIAMYLAKTLTPHSYPEIGRRFGNRDHTTIIHAVRKIEKLSTDSHSLSLKLDVLRRKIAAVTESTNESECEPGLRGKLDIGSI